MTEPGSPRRTRAPEPASPRGRAGPVTDRDPGLRIDPIRIGPRRSVVSAVIVFACSLTFIALAVVKPWEWGQPSVAIASPSIPPHQPIVAPKPSPRPLASGPLVANADLVAASSARDAWGIRAVALASGASPRSSRIEPPLVERWVGVDRVTVDGSMPSGSPATPGDEVVALGVTTPDDQMPLDVRFWRLEPGVPARRVVPVPVPGPEAGSWLWRPDPAESADGVTWPSGTYRLDVLLGSTIIRLETTVPANGPDVTRGVPEVGEPADLITRLGTSLPGPFAVTPRDLITVDVTPHEALNERLAWLGPAAGRIDAAAIGQVAADPVSGLGLLFAPDEQFLAADLELVGSSGIRPPVDTFRLPEVTRPDGGTEMAVLMERGDRTPFDTGLYHLSVVSGRSTGDKVLNWNLEILPSPSPPTPGTPLVWMRSWIPMLADLDHQVGQPLVSDRDLGAADGDGTCGGSAHIGTSDLIIGLVEPGEIRVVRVRLVPMGGPTLADVPIRYAPNAAVGLTLVAVPSGGLAAGSYRMIVDTSAAAGSDGRRLYTICVT